MVDDVATKDRVMDVVYIVSVDLRRIAIRVNCVAASVLVCILSGYVACYSRIADVNVMSFKHIGKW